MCKLIIIPNAKNIKDPTDFAKKCADILSDQRDGYGYAYQGKDGVFGSKTLYPTAFAKIDNVPDYVESLQNDFGNKSQVTGGALFHGRISTNNVSVINTHPIQRDDWHLIHNGVVTDHGDKYSMLTTNDTEHVLYRLISGGIDSVAKNLTGYYACGAFAPDGSLHVFKDKIAPLVYAESKTLKSPIFASNNAILLELGKFLKEVLTPLPVKNDTYLVFNSGVLTKHESFKSQDADEYSIRLSGRSLGYDWNSLDYLNDKDDLLYDVSEEFLEEIKYLDESYEISQGSHLISIYEFIELPLDSQVECIIKRSDGTILDPYEVKVNL